MGEPFVPGDLFELDERIVAQRQEDGTWTLVIPPTYDDAWVTAAVRHGVGRVVRRP